MNYSDVNEIPAIAGAPRISTGAQTIKNRPVPYATQKSDLQQLLATQGYVHLNETELGLPAGAHQWFGANYFRFLEADLPEVSKTRLRARDSIMYGRFEDSVILHPANDVTIRNYTNHAMDRNYKRLSMIGDPLAESMVRNLLDIIPPEDRQLAGSFSVNFFRTREKVVNTRHQDGEDYIVIYVCKLEGEIPVTELTKDRDGKDVVYAGKIKPGEIFIFKDERFFHYTADIGNTAFRDALIMTIDRPTNGYLGPQST